jgi:hypothetical protein
MQNNQNQADINGLTPEQIERFRATLTSSAKPLSSGYIARYPGNGPDSGSLPQIPKLPPLTAPSQPCPNCGHCPHCGRSNWPLRPTYTQPYIIW